MVNKLVDLTSSAVAKVPGLSRALARNIGFATVFHQIVDTRRPFEGTAFCNQMRSEFHEVVGYLAGLQSPSTDLWITFDDGYAAAAAVLDEIAPRFPNVRFVFFICPEKTSAQVGFRWDAWERQHDSAPAVADFRDFTRAPVTLEENHREDLRAAADDGRFRLATVAECLALTRHSNVHLGNHSNRHIELAAMDAADAEDEIRSSTAHFSSVFGATRHFAFPYGTPGVSYDEGHVRLLRSLGYEYIWSTQPLGFARGSEHDITIPRIAVNGLRTVAATKADITKYLVKTRMQRFRNR